MHQPGFGPLCETLIDANRMLTLAKAGVATARTPDAQAASQRLLETAQDRIRHCETRLMAVSIGSITCCERNSP